MLRDSTVARRRAYAPTSYTAAHDNHEKISSWVSFSLYGYGAPLGGPSGRRSSAIKVVKSSNHLFHGRASKGHGSSPGFTSQTSLHACLQRPPAMQIGL